MRSSGVVCLVVWVEAVTDSVWWLTAAVVTEVSDSVGIVLSASKGEVSVHSYHVVFR